MSMYKSFTKNRIAMLGALTAALSLSASLANAGDVIVNGGFETGDFTGWITGANSYPEYLVNDPVNSGNWAAQIAGYDFGPDTLSQVVADAPGQNYNFSFAWNDTGGLPDGLTVTWDGNVIFTENTGGAHGYETVSGVVTGTGLDTLIFSAYNNPGFIYLDDVSATPVPD